MLLLALCAIGIRLTLKKTNVKCLGRDGTVNSLPNECMRFAARVSKLSLSWSDVSLSTVYISGGLQGCSDDDGVPVSGASAVTGGGSGGGRNVGDVSGGGSGGGRNLGGGSGGISGKWSWLTVGNSCCEA